jgi:rhodanese-related sulfurtransferase
MFGFFRSAQPAAAPAFDNIRMVNVATARAWIEADQVVLIDVREDGEWVSGHIAGATLLPLSRFNPLAIPKVPAGKKLLIHCRSGQRCGTAAQLLAASGYAGEINRLEGGIMAWVMAGWPVETGA